MNVNGFITLGFVVDPQIIFAPTAPTGSADLLVAPPAPAAVSVTTPEGPRPPIAIATQV